MKVPCKSFTAAILLSFALFIALSCTKSDITTGTSTIPSTGTPGANSPTPPVAMAGADQSRQLPVDSITLTGNYFISNQFDRIEWQKIAGPACLIDDQRALTTKVRALQPGIYRFVLTVYDKANLQGRDTVAVSVFPAFINTGQHPAVFESLNWIFPWYNSLEVKNIYSYVPMGVPIRVFVQRASSLNWIEAYPVTNNSANIYEYFIETRPDGAGMYDLGSLYVFYYGADVSDSPKVKVEF